eukprot:TRINITY_DN513_c0_g1_i1.p1 TRINITY_DN513_c0_g1~~TRINITY_DN513_c0_g1_i1.p1  ORF type:complete len:1380 (+),score=595.80 TRINITY_DN513_c0_g1_i1:88-4140(+)
MASEGGSPAADRDAGAAGKDVSSRRQENPRPCHCLGFRPPSDGIPGARVIEHNSDDSIVYLAGRHAAIYSYENHGHRFILKHPKTQQIVAFAVSSNRRYIALSEKVIDEESGEMAVQLSIYNFNTATRMRTLPLSKVGKQPVESLDFSRDNKYMVSVSAPPDPFIHFWQLDKARLLRFTELRSRVSRVSISPWAHWTMCTTGASSLRIWRYLDKELKSVDPVPKRSNKDYRFTSHSWFDDDRLVVGTEEGDALIIDGAELKKVIHSVYGSGIKAGVAVIQSVGRGFVAGGDGGAFAVYERTYDNEYFQPYKTLRTPDRHRIIDISISPGEENLVCCYDNNSLALFNLANIDIMDHEKPDDVAQAFPRLPIGFHHDTITGMDVCIQKPIVVTTSLDKTIRVWNFFRKKVEIRKECDDEALTVSVHPTGTRILVGFKPRMCMYNVLVDDLHLIQEFPIKQCREVRFSHGGQYFAAVVVNRIFLFDSYTFEAIGHLTGHSSMVKSFAWMRNDAGLVSVGFEGAVYEWRTETCKRNETNEYVHKSLAFSAVCWDEASQLVATVGCSKVAEPPDTAEGEVALRVLKLAPAEQGHIPVKATIRLGMAEAKISHTRNHTRELALSPSAQSLFVGSPSGQLLVFKWPMKLSSPTCPPEPELALDVHQGEVWFLVLSTDEKYLFTVGEDRCLFMFDVESLLTDGRQPVRKQTFNYTLFDEVAYVLQQDIDERVRDMSALQVMLSEEQRARRAEKEGIESHYSALLIQTESEAQRQIESAKQAQHSSDEERRATEVRMLEEAQQIEAQRMRDIQELEGLHSKRAKDMAAKLERLTEERQDLVVRYESKLLKVQKEREQERQRADAELKAVLEQRDRLVEQLTAEHKRTARESEGVLKDTEEEHEKEVQLLEKKRQELADEKDRIQGKAQSDVEMYKRKYDKHENEKKALKKELEVRLKDIERKESEIADLKKQIATLRLEISVRNDTISASEKKILELKKQTAELEKLRYVLTFKFNELRKEVAPKDDSIRHMNERIEEMDEEIEKIGTDRDVMSQRIADKEDKCAVVLKEVHRLNRQIDDQRRMMQMLLTELVELILDADPKKQVFALRDVVEKYSKQADRVTEPSDSSKLAAAGFDRQRFYMEAQLSTLKKQNQRREEHMKADGLRKTAENALLVREINDLRHEKKLLTQRLQLADSHVKEARMAAVRSPGAVLSPGAASPPGSGGTPQRPDAEFALGNSPSPTGSARRDASPPKGKIARGSTRALRDITRMDPAKIAELVQLVEQNNADMVKQQQEIQRLRDFVQHLLLRQKGEAAETSSPEHRPQQPPQTAQTPPPSGGASLQLPDLPPRSASEAR